MLRKMLLLTSLIIAGLALSACGAAIHINPFTAEETVTQSFTSAAPPRLVVEMFNGSVDVVAGTDNTVRVDVTKRGGGISQAAAEDDLKNVAVTMTQDGTTIRVTAKRSDQPVDIGNSGASAKLRVPDGALLELRTSNGPITLSGPLGDATAQTSNGPINARGSRGQLDLNTSNGPVTINGGSGLLSVETSNGPITIDTETATVSARTSNGPVTFTGSLTGRNDLRTSNGSLSVTLPATATFAVNASTSNGKISSDFPITSADRGEDYVRGTVGSDPGTTLELETSNGPISLRQSHP